MPTSTEENLTPTPQTPQPVVKPTYNPVSTGANPTQVAQSTKEFGQDSAQFNIEPFAQPFPYQDQQSQNQAYTQAFTQHLAGTETPEQTRERYENRYGYRDQQENYLRTKEAAEGVMSAARAAPEQIQQRTAPSLITQGQLASIQNKEVGDLMKTYTQLGELNEQQGRRLAITEQNMNTAAKLEMAQQQKMMTPWLQQYQDKNIMQAREFSGWTFANQLELNRLVSNQQAGLTWTNAESTRAHELSMQENAFDNSVKMLEKQNEMALDLW